MRYDTKVYFQRRVPGAYVSDPDAEGFGDYGEDTVTETLRYASVASMTAKKQQILFGAVREDAVEAHLQNRYEDPFDAVRIGSYVYTEASRTDLRTKGILYLSGRKEEDHA